MSCRIMRGRDAQVVVDDRRAVSPRRRRVVVSLRSEKRMSGRGGRDSKRTPVQPQRRLTGSEMANGEGERDRVISECVMTRNRGCGCKDDERQGGDGIASRQGFRPGFGYGDRGLQRNRCVQDQDGRAQQAGCWCLCRCGRREVRVR